MPDRAPSTATALGSARGRFHVTRDVPVPALAAPATELTMDPTFFSRGLIIGFTVAMTVGPMSVLT
ncbi:MAG TPA: hypothetical protein VE817_04175, partial [Candidatus Acidoferrum sp.]|nr:hypothetical protein [Candidatus Acidoferrum sp.]